WSKDMTTAEVQAGFDRGGVPASPYRTVKEAMAEPQITHRGSFTAVQDAGGRFLAINPPFQMTGATAAAPTICRGARGQTAGIAARDRLRRTGDRGVGHASANSGSQVTTTSPTGVRRTRLTVWARSGEPE